MHNAYLYIDGLKFPVKYLEYNFRQFTGTNNKPNTRVFGGEFSFTFDIDDKKAVHLIDWMLSSTMQKKGYIEIMDFNQTSIAFKLEFANAYATSQQFHYDAFSNLPLQSNVTVTCGAMRVGKEVTYLQTWNPEDPFTIQSTQIVNDEIEENAPYFLGYHIEDKNNNIIEEKKIKKNQVIYLVINSKNANGQIVDIDLTNKSIDYEYNGKHMKNDIISDITLVGKTTKVKLRAIKQKS